MNFKDFFSMHKKPVIISAVCLCVIISATVILIARNAGRSSQVSEIISNANFDSHTPPPPKEPRHHNYNLDNIITDGELKKYYDEQGNPVSFIGTDISYHQKSIDWEKLKSSGIDFIMLRMGYRGYESGNLFIDSSFPEYAAAAAEAGIDIGVYFFSQSLNVEEAEEEAMFVIQNLNGYNITYPVAYDWEPVPDEASRTNEPPYKELTASCITFCDIIKKAGYTPIIYSNRNQAMNDFDMNQLERYDIWIAEYLDSPLFPYDFAMWQYTCDGHIDGIEGRVDLNICFKDYRKNSSSVIN